MKLCTSFKALALSALALAAKGTEARIDGQLSRNLKNDKNDKNKDDNKDDGGICGSCEDKLPYKYFYEGFCYDRFGTEACIQPGGINQIDLEADLVIWIASYVSDVIYSSDALSCLLLSLGKTARDTICVIADYMGVPNPDIMSRGVLGPIRKLQDGNPLTTNIPPTRNMGEMMLNVLATMNITTAEGVRDLFNIPLPDPRDGGGRNLGDRELLLIPPAEIGEGLDYVINKYLSQDLKQYLLGESFFFKCVEDYGAPESLCVVIFSLLRTFDAVVCKMMEEAQCSIEDDCTPELKFKTEYNARRLADYLPFEPLNFLLADILAPCDNCELKKQKCSGFCNFVDGQDECDPIKRIWIAEEIL